MDAPNEPSRKHDDDPVAGWVAEGLRDAEIAVRLGVSVGEARARRSGLQEARSPGTALALPSSTAQADTGPRPVELPAPARGWAGHLGAGVIVALLAAAAA